MALKKAEDKAPVIKEPTAEELAAKLAEEQKLLDDAAEQKASDEAAAAVAEEARLQELADQKTLDDAETIRQAERQLEADRQAADEAERLAQDAEVAIAAGKEPLELKLVLVESLTHSDLRQHSTNKWIEGKGQAHLLNDGWLANQIASKLVRIVKED